MASSSFPSDSGCKRPPGATDLRTSPPTQCLSFTLPPPHLGTRAVAKIQPLSASAKLKHRDRVLGRGENNFIALPGKSGGGGSQQDNVLKTVPPTPLERIARRFIVKRRKNRFSERNQDWDRYAFFFLWGQLSHQSWSQETSA